MRRAIRKYRGLPNKELTVAYRKVSRELDRAYSNALRVGEQMAEDMEEHKPSNIKKLQKLDDIVNCIQVELDTIGMMKTGRFG